MENEVNQYEYENKKKWYNMKTGETRRFDSEESKNCINHHTVLRVPGGWVLDGHVFIPYVKSIGGKEIRITI